MKYTALIEIKCYQMLRLLPNVACSSSLLSWFCFVCFHKFKQLFLALSPSAPVCRKLYGTLTYLDFLTHLNYHSFDFSNHILIVPVARGSRNCSAVLDHLAQNISDMMKYLFHGSLHASLINDCSLRVFGLCGKGLVVGGG